MWEVTVDHARTCELGRKVHLYWHTAEKKTAVAFNVVGQVMGMVLECQFVSSDKLSDTELVCPCFLHNANTPVMLVKLINSLCVWMHYCYTNPL